MHPRAQRRLVGYVRYGLPASLAIVGLLTLIFGSGEMQDALGVLFLGFAGLILAANVLIRLSISSQDDRDEEERRRRSD